MKTFVATSGNQFHIGRMSNCLNWADGVISEIPDASIVVKIHKVRPEQKDMMVVCEVTGEGIRKIMSGRVVPLRAFKRVTNG